MRVVAKNESCKRWGVALCSAKLLDHIFKERASLRSVIYVSFVTRSIASGKYFPVKTMR